MVENSHLPCHFPLSSSPPLPNLFHTTRLPVKHHNPSPALSSNRLKGEEEKEEEPALPPSSLHFRYRKRSLDFQASASSMKGGLVRSVVGCWVCTHVFRGESGFTTEEGGLDATTQAGDTAPAPAAGGMQSTPTALGAWRMSELMPHQNAIGSGSDRFCRFWVGFKRVGW